MWRAPHGPASAGLALAATVVWALALAVSGGDGSGDVPESGTNVTSAAPGPHPSCMDSMSNGDIVQALTPARFAEVCATRKDTTHVEVDPSAYSKSFERAVQLGGLFATNGTGFLLEDIEWGTGARSAFLLSVDFINNASHILPGTFLSAWAENTEGDPSVGVRKALELIQEARVSALVGPGYSSIAKPVGTIGSVFSTPQVSYSAGNPDLSNKALYPNFLRTISTVEQENRALLSVCRQLNLFRIVVLYLDSFDPMAFIPRWAGDPRYGVEVIKVLKVSFDSSRDDIRAVVDAMTASRSRVFVSNVFGVDGALLFEMANAAGLTGPGFLWLLGSSASSNAEPLPYMYGSLAVSEGRDYLKSPGWTEFRRVYVAAGADQQRYPGAGRFLDAEGDSPDGNAHSVWDAVHAVAYAIQAVLEPPDTTSNAESNAESRRRRRESDVAIGARVEAKTTVLPVVSVDGDALATALFASNFTGATQNPLVFTSTGDALSSMALFNVVGVRDEAGRWAGHQELVANIRFDGDSAPGTFEPLKAVAFAWPPHLAHLGLLQPADFALPIERAVWLDSATGSEKRVAVPLPFDCDPDGCGDHGVCVGEGVCECTTKWTGKRCDVLAWVDYGDAVVVVFTVLAILLMLLTLAVAYVIWKHRDTPVVRRSSPTFCAFMLVGILLGYITTFVWAGEPGNALCVSQIWMGPLAFAIVFSALLAKTWRIYRIFDNARLRRVVITDKDLAVVAALTAAPMLLIQLVWSAASPLEPAYRLEKDSRVLVCASSDSNVGLGCQYALLVYSILLMLFGCFLSFKTRKVDTSFRESRFIAATIYNILAVSCVFLGMLFFFKDLQETPVTMYVLKALVTIVTATSVLVCMFAPKLYVTILRSEKNTEEYITSRQNPSQAASQPERSQRSDSVTGTGGRTSSFSVTPGPPVKPSADASFGSVPEAAVVRQGSSPSAAGSSGLHRAAGVRDSRVSFQEKDTPTKSASHAPDTDIEMVNVSVPSQLAMPSDARARGQSLSTRVELSSQVTGV